MKDTTTIPYKIYLTEDELPRNWYNVRADMTNKPAPLLNPGTLQPMTAEELGHVFCDELVKQELDDTTAYIPIPQEIRDFYKMYRPSPLVRAYCLEEKLDTPAHIYLRQPQAELRHRAGVFRQGAGAAGRYHRDGRRAVGYGAEHGLRLSGAGLPCVHGQVLL